MPFFHRGRTLQLPTGAIVGRSTRRFIKFNSLRRSEVDPHTVSCRLLAMKSFRYM